MKIRSAKQLWIDATAKATPVEASVNGAQDSIKLVVEVKATRVHAPKSALDWMTGEPDEENGNADQ